MKCVASVHTKPCHTCVAIHEIFRKQQKPFTMVLLVKCDATTMMEFAIILPKFWIILSLSTVKERSAVRSHS